METEKTSESEIALLNDTIKRMSQRILYVEQQNTELFQSEQRYHKMVGEVEDYAIIMLDKNGIIQNWNKGAQKIKGYKADEIIGKSFRLFYLKNDQENGMPEQLIMDALKQGTALHEGWRIRKNGSVFWGSIVITALHDENGNHLGFSKVTRDLTEKKLNEDRLRQYSSELESKNQELEQFVYIASHDMKEPLRKIVLFNNLLIDKLHNIGPKEKGYLLRSINAATRMRSLIDDLLDYSQTSMKQNAFEEVDLNIVLSEVLALYNEKIAEIDAEITVEKLPIVMGIPFQMAQLFDNLIGNALKYHSHDHETIIEVRYKKLLKPPIGLNLDSKKAYHQISVVDNGVGFDEVFSQKIFEIFQRLVTKDEYSGTGIGLAICKKVVQHHKGAIMATGEENKGATFVVYLPLAL